MNFKANEVSATLTDGNLPDSSSPEEPGGKKNCLAEWENLPFLCLENERTNAFRLQYYPSVSLSSWEDWKWQIRNSITTPGQLERFIFPDQEEKEALTNLQGRLPLRITPYYLSLLVEGGKENPIRKMVVPTLGELLISPEEMADSLNEMGSSPVPGLVHRYPDRVLFLVTQYCSTYCRYCTRSHSVGKLSHSSVAQWDIAIDYIASHPEIRDVLISGGDPLTLPDHRLEYLLSRLSRIPHVEIIRIGTKVPVVLPQRITPELVSMFRKYHPIWMSIHFSHPDEVTPETAAACERLCDAGIPLGSQTVLLNGINDNPAVMKDLFHKLLKIRVQPYYLYQCDLVPGSRHFRTSLSKGLEIMKSLRGYTSGYANPYYVIDAPGGGGKIPLLPDYIVKTGKEGVTLHNYLGKTYFYPDI